MCHFSVFGSSLFSVIGHYGQSLSSSVRALALGFVADIDCSLDMWVPFRCWQYDDADWWWLCWQSRWQTITMTSGTISSTSSVIFPRFAEHYIDGCWIEIMSYVTDVTVQHTRFLLLRRPMCRTFPVCSSISFVNLLWEISQHYSQQNPPFVYWWYANENRSEVLVYYMLGAVNNS